MSEAGFKVCLILFGGGFAAVFGTIVIPALWVDGDVIGGFAAGFVNPYASGYALDAIACWCLLAAWVIYEARRYRIRGGWLALLLGVAPGVATGFALYLWLRLRQRALLTEA